MKTWQFPLLAGAIIALTACGGSSSSSNSNTDKAPENPDSNNRYGRVIDGYLENATVCIDGNNNNQCDANEKSLRTDAQGRFNLAGLENKALIAQAIAGITKDADDNGATITQSFTLSAPANHSGVITPFTTLLVTLEKSGLTSAEALATLSSSLNIPAASLAQNYIAQNSTLPESSSMKKIAQLLVDTIQKISAQALASSENSSQDQRIIETLAWRQITPDTLEKMVELMAQQSDALPSNLATQWIAAVPQLAITKEEISGTDPIDPVDPVDPVDPTDPIDPVDPVEPTPNSQFSKISATGSVLANNATDYACVTQNINAAGQTIPSVARNTWMLLIPADATFATVGFTPVGYTATDLFWSYSWEPDASFPSLFKQANGLTSRYNDENQVEIYVELLNKINYCGFSDWTVPSINDMQTLNTHPLVSDTAVKTLDRTVFKNFADFETQVFNRSKTNNGDIDPQYYNYLVNPFFWTSTRTEENGVPDTSIGDYKKYLHPTETSSTEEIFIETPGAGPYFALRAMRNNRFQRIATDGSELDLTSTDWQCVKDSAAQGRRHWGNPVAELNNVKFENISATIETFNTANKCNFNDWRLPTKKELLTLKPLHSDAYFNITDLKSYVWIQAKAGDDDDAVQLRRQSDYDLSHSYMSNHKVKLILVRDDIASAEMFDANIEKHTSQVATIDTLQNDFDAIIINTAASTEADLKAAFKALATLPALIEIRQQNLTPAERLLITITAQYSALYSDMKTSERHNNLTTATDEQLRIETALIDDANALKIQLEALFSQYDALSSSSSFSSDTAKAEVLSQGISSAASILNLLTNIGTALGAEDTKAALETIITTRESEAETLPKIGLNGGFIKIAENGDIAKNSANYGDDWRCVKHVAMADDFTTTRYWTLLNETTDTAIKREAMMNRLEAINTEVLCGIDHWTVPTLSALKSLSILDIATENNEATKTIDSSIFINHKDIADVAPQYWYNDESSYVLRYATDTQKEDDSIYVSSWNGNNFANARFVQESISYLKTDMTCGADAITYQNACYQKYDESVNWNTAKETCVNNGQNLIAKEALMKTDYIKLAIGLNLDSQSNYWLGEDANYKNYAYSLAHSNNQWSRTSSVQKSQKKSFICAGPTVPLITPSTPTSAVHDDNANTFGWTNATGFSNASDYQFSLDNGVTWQDANENPININNKNIESGFVQVRVKAIEDQNLVGDILKSTQAFTKIEGLCAGGDAAAEISDQCYTRHDAIKKWTDARDFCANNGASLVVESDALNIASDLASEINLKTSSTHYWLLDNQLNYGRARALTQYSGWRAYDKQVTLQLPFICMK